MNKSIKDVAKHAGVSIATVSNVINKTKTVSSDLEKRVRSSIKDLNYQKNPNASRLKTLKTNMIGIIISSINTDFFPQVIAGIQSEAQKNGYLITFFPANNDYLLEMKYLNILLENCVDGIIIDSVVPSENTEYFTKLRNLNINSKKIPVVSIERNLSEKKINSVYVDNYENGCTATEHLINKKCSKIVHLTGPLCTPWSVERLNGYKSALIKNGLDIDESLITTGDFTSMSGYIQIKRALLNGIVFDGIFSANDLMAIGAVKALQEHNIAIPAEVKVIGYDNIIVSSLIAPSLTTINIPKKRLGEEAAKMLTNMISNPLSAGVESIKLPFNLIERQSSNQNITKNWELISY